MQCSERPYGQTATSNLIRIDKVDGDYEIIDQIEEEIDACDLVIADLTLLSANVIFELGYARGRGKRVIQTCRENTIFQFDVRGRRTLMYSNATILEEKLLRQFDALYGGAIHGLVSDPLVHSHAA